MNTIGEKIVLATRTDQDGLKECVEKIERLLTFGYIAKGYIVYKGDPKIENNIVFVHDDNPTRESAFQLVIDSLQDDFKNSGNKYHLLTFSKEVEFNSGNIEKMLSEIEQGIIVVGYKLCDNVLSERETRQFGGGENFDDYGVAYQVPWNTYALWNKEFVYGSGDKKLIFDKMCEGNQPGNLEVVVNGIIIKTDYKGMEDGLAIARLISKDPDLKFKLIDEILPWRIDEKFERRLKHKVKMARKNAVLSHLINVNGYSIDKLMESKIKTK